jgi:predicted RNase H-like nuclease (RuvC/YqgF family)
LSKKADIIHLEEKLRHLNDNNNKLYTRIHELKLAETNMIRGDNNLLGNIDEQISIHNDISSNTVSINKLIHRLLFYKRNIELFIRRVNSLRDIVLN